MTFLIIGIFYLPIFDLKNTNKDNFHSFKNIGYDDLNKYNIINHSLGVLHSAMTLDTNNDGYGDKLYTWGNNTHGQLGLGHKFDHPLTGERTNRNIPTRITSDFIKNKKIINLELGGFHSAVTIDTNNDGYGDKLYTWGMNNYGQLGHGDEENRDIPTEVTSDFIKGKKIINLSLGQMNTSVTIDTNGDNYGDKLYIWGNNQGGQLGLDSSIIDKVNTPIPVDFFEDKKIINLSLGFFHSAVTIDTRYGDNYGDKLYTWGLNGSGQLGLGTTINKHTPTEVKTLTNKKITNLSLGENHSAVTIDTSGNGYGYELYTWGSNTVGQLGINSTSDKTYPTKVKKFVNEKMISLTLGSYYSSVTIDTNDDNYGDKFFTWGSSTFGESGLGIGDYENVLIPSEVKTLTGKKIITSSLGGWHSLTIIDTNNDGYGDELYTWGYNRYGQLGQVDEENRNIPTLLVFSFYEPIPYIILLVVNIIFIMSLVLLFIMALSSLFFK